MRLWFAACLSLCLISIAPHDSVAQTPDIAQMKAFTQTSFYHDLISQVVGRIPDTIFKRCPTLITNGSQTSVLVPVTFGANGRPNGGTWHQAFPVSGCGDDKVLNLYFSASAEGKINAIIAAPGDTHADLTLQHDTLFYADMGATAAAKDCKNFAVSNTHFDAIDTTSQPPPGVDPLHHSWTETWTMVGCGHIVDVPIRFIPDAKGTTITTGKGVAR